MAGAGWHLRRTHALLVAGKEAGLHVFVQAVSWVYGTVQQRAAAAGGLAAAVEVRFWCL